MRDINEIASRIANIILSPNTVTGLIHGALSVPVDLGYLVYGFFDTDSRYRHETVRIRMADAIKHDILNHDNITNAAKLIFSKFNEYVSESKQDEVYSSVVSSITGRLLTSMLVTNIATSIIQRVSLITSPKGSAFSFIFLLGGMMERSIRTSENLLIESPEVYGMLRPRDYDLLYFLMEPAVQPFVDAIHVKTTQGLPAFNRILKLVEDKINGS